jgi:hypothetical protein
LVRAQCSPPAQCLQNWSPSPCAACQVNCDVCTFFLYCGSAANNDECDILVSCAQTRLVKMFRADGPQFGASGVSGEDNNSGLPCEQIYRASPELFNGQGYHNTVRLEVYDLLGNRLCSTVQNFNCF